jgi:phage/plasmid primase-like uncharacterized protein
MQDSIADIARRLAENAEAVCRHYLSNGRREGRYWLVGDVHNTPGRSLYVRLSGSTSGDDRGVGNWTDAAEAQHGDLLDLIAAARDLDGIGPALDEARRFLGLAPSVSLPKVPVSGRSATHEVSLRRSAPAAEPQAGTDEAARRLFQRSTPIAGTLASTYLRARGIDVVPDMTALRFHPRCWYRREADSAENARDTWPALIAAVTDLDGAVTGVQRTWLDPSGQTKAPLAVPRRAMGHLLGHAVRFGPAGDVLVAGEGIETMLSLRAILPDLPVAAALSAAHLAGLRLPPGLRRLYIICDNDPAGRHASATLTARAQATGVEALTLMPVLKDINDDLRQFGPDALAASVRDQLAPEDVIRFWRAPEQEPQIAEPALAVIENSAGNAA